MRIITLVIAFVIVSLSLSANVPPTHKDSKVEAIEIKAEPPSPKLVKPAPPTPVVAAPVVAPTPVYVPPAPVSDNYAKQYIYDHESGNCVTKWQYQTSCPTSFIPLYDPSTPGIGYGLCQSTPAIKMSDPTQGGGPDWATSYATQDSWCTHYANTRYGGWVNAYNHWLVYHSW